MASASASISYLTNGTEQLSPACFTPIVTRLTMHQLRTVATDWRPPKVQTENFAPYGLLYTAAWLPTSFDVSRSACEID